jgi:hypothetical protein
MPLWPRRPASPATSSFEGRVGRLRTALVRVTPIKGDASAQYEDALRRLYELGHHPHH